MDYKIPLFDLNFDEKEEKAVLETIKSKWISTGPKTLAFENKFSEMFKVKHAVAVSNCTVALHLAMKLLDINEGDEVTVKGPLGFFNGLTQIIADSITVVSTGNTLKDATEVTSLSEDTESDLVKFTKVWFVDNTITEWPSNNSELTNGTDTFAVRVDSDTKGIIGSPVFDTMNIQGLGGQFDNSAPYDEGYQLFPMDSTYITEWVLTSVKEFAVEARVYPNPAQNNLTVIGTEKWNTFEVYNIVGSKVSEGELNNNNLSVSDLVEGTYIIKLQAGNRAGVARFVINR